ncbi:hypothetical protein TVAG_005400 [Trichomonas vaginalis G3]|uniref:Uncharacterized protein n=1 Tax=Trichomonas vaginalis (strain ATCC PRA-98 / G3) TaxID=412133 RepID=A2ENS0_TRIV3|nr:hypothetical protein TVAGG3_0666580 [Trichomonas vaginalis G3]EAY05696.1 hypothetical protein TVAG_005400 [Trichomonas vaginalis G3]KAI5506876.1 hypothetical protein TVAGG3_0666580 [Trichomonas vaginalis G3]|eukprot:XP_001317919.1 hypothetical protein [Trichomonas vaginalis G3]
MKRGRKPRPIPTSVINKKKEKERIEELYYAERKRLYAGEEEFMNTYHPFEESKKGCGKKSSPLQKAIIFCMKQNNGAATEEQLLEFVRNKWDIIMKYTPRGFSMEPSLRVIRLNLVVRKKARHLFLKDPKNKDLWMLNSNLRKIPVKRTLFKSSAEEIPEENIENLASDSGNYSDSEPDSMYGSYIMNHDTFERHVEDFMRSIQTSVKIEEIANSLSKYKEKQGLFQCLPFERRIRACLVVLKSEGRVFFDELTNTWSNQKPPTKIEKPSENRYLLTDVKIQNLTIDELYEMVKNKCFVK